MERCDVLILGAGAAGMMAAIETARRGRRTVVLDHAAQAGEKIRISGGGRCNFTNLSTEPERFLSQNPRFALSALSRFGPRDFLARVEAAGIGWVEKAAGQLFSADRSEAVVAMLTGALAAAGARLLTGVAIGPVRRAGAGFVVETAAGVFHADSLIVATGGKSVPKMGATGLGYRIAEAFGLGLVETRPGLVPLTFAAQDLPGIAALAGLGVTARVACGRQVFEDGLLFTHRGLSGPAILQISSYWREGGTITIDLAPGTDIAAALKLARGAGGRGSLAAGLARHLPERLAARVLEDLALAPQGADGAGERAGGGGPVLAAQGNAALDRIGQRVNRWQVRPVGSEGYRTAEVTLGGVDTRALDARRMEARGVPGLFLAGEVVDVTGWLGGYNLQWAWSSGWVAGQAA